MCIYAYMYKHKIYMMIKISVYVQIQVIIDPNTKSILFAGISANEMLQLKIRSAVFLLKSSDFPTTPRPGEKQTGKEHLPSGHLQGNLP